MNQRKSLELDRRGFLATAAALAAIPLTRALAARTIPVGVQLWCVRNELAEDLPGTLAALAKIGFEAVEFADYFGRSAAELRRELDRAGLKCCGTHIYLEDMLGDKLPATVEFNQTLGNRNLIVRWLGEERRASPTAFAATVDAFNQVSERLKPHGMRVGYHNHDYIFQRFDGEMLWNILADRTGPEVILQLDTGNASRAGQDVIELLKRNPGRTRSVHVKPYSKANPKAFLGQDDLDWKKILDLCRTSAGTEWFIVEYEEEGVEPLEALKANFETLKRMLA